MKSPVVSIIVPVYNVGQYLPKCLDSIQSQTFTDWEAILVNDGSSDLSGSICDEYAMNDPRFVVIHKQNEGVAKARITAFEHSRGDLITFVDSDDYVSPDYISILSKPILENNVDMVSCDYYRVEGSKLIEPRAKLNGIWENEQIKDFVTKHFFYDSYLRSYGITICLWSKMMKRYYVLEGLKQGEDLWYAEDQIAVFYSLLQCKKIELLPNRLYYYVQHEGQTMKKYNFGLWENLFLLMEKYQKLDVNNITAEGRRKRIWLQIIFTIRKKMIPSGISINLFVNHLSIVRKEPYMQTFFRPCLIKLGWKNEIFYWLIKIRCYRILFILLTRIIRQ